MTSSNGHLPANRKVYIQQSSNGRSGWRTLGYLVAAGGTGNYNVEGYIEHPSGYWRLYYPVQGDFQQALSRVVHLSRYDTQVAGYKVSPTKVRKGKQVTVSGTLQKLTSPKWSAFGKQKVYLLFRAKGGSSYGLAGTVSTTSKGKFSKKVKPARDGYFLAVWLTPNSRYVDAVSKEVFVDVR
jgi:hypothetical protein